MNRKFVGEGGGRAGGGQRGGEEGGREGGRAGGRERGEGGGRGMRACQSGTPELQPTVDEAVTPAKDPRERP